MAHSSTKNESLIAKHSRYLDHIDLWPALNGPQKKIKANVVMGNTTIVSFSFSFLFFFSLALSVSPCRISVFLDAASWIRRKYSIDLSLGDGQFVWLVTGHWRAMCQTLATNGPVTPEATQILLISKLALQTFLILVCCN